ncbi:MAG: flavin reductase family protein [Chloroflexota bacterium]
MTDKEISPTDFIDDPGDLRAVMRYWTTGVCIVSTQHENVDHGMTVNSFTSVSLSPPLVTLSLEGTARTHEMVQSTQFFGITILAGNQEDVSNRFAGRDTENQDRFDGYVKERLLTGSPFLKGGLAYLDCKVKSHHPVGPNLLYIAEVVAVKLNPEFEVDGPLLYFSRGYHRLL